MERGRWWVLAAALLLGSCHVENPTGSILSVDADSTWTGYDSLVLTLRDSEGTILDTLFHARFRSAPDLNRLPALYDGGKVTVVLEGYLGGKPVRRESRQYDGRTGEVYVISAEDLTVLPPAGAVLDIRPDNLVAYLGGLKEVLGPGSAWAGDLVWTTGDTSIAKVRDGEVTAVGPGRTYVKALATGGQKDSSWVEVVRDSLVLDAGEDTAVAVNSHLAWSVRVTQAHGKVDMFRWDLDGDGNWDDSATGFPVGHSILATPARLYDVPRELTLRFYVRDGEGNEDSAKRHLTVASKVPSVDSLGAKPALASIGDTLRFSARAKAGEGSLQTYAWDLDGNGVTDDSGTFTGPSALLTTTRAFPSPGLFPATFRLKDGLGRTVSGQVTVDIRRASPTSDAGENVQALVGTTVNLAGTGIDSLDGRIVAREWILGSAAPVRVDSGGRISFPAQSPGVLTCIFRVTDDDGLTDDDTVKVEILDGDAPEIVFLTPPATLSIRDSLAFTVSAKGASARLSRFAWDFDGDGDWDDSGTVDSDSVLQTRGFRFQLPKTYLVAFRAVDAAGLSATKTLSIVVKEDRPWAKAVKDTSVSLGTRLTLRGTDGDTLGRVVKREWKGDDSVFVETPTGEISFTPRSAGDLLCIYRVTDDDGLTAQATVTVEVKASSQAILSDLVLAAGAARPALQPNFSSEQKTYTAVVPFTTDTLRIIPTVPPGSGSTILVKAAEVASGTASLPIALNVGTNSLAVSVIAQDGSQVADYIVDVFRQLNGDASLEKLVPSAGALSRNFDTSLAPYDLKLDSSVASLSLTLTPKHPSTTLKVNGLPAAADVAHGPIDLPMGKTRISIEATAQSGAIKTYTVWATRGPWIFTLDDFNARRRTSALAKPWHYLDDRVEGGDSRVTSGDTSSTPALVNDSSFTAGKEGLAIRMAFTYGAIKPSCGGPCTFGQYVTLRTGDTSVTNMTGATHMSFQARASSPMRVLVKLETSNVLDLAYFQAPMDLTTQWVRYTIVFANMVQPPWSVTPKPLDLTKVRGFHWHISADDNAALTQGVFYLDDVNLQGWRGP